MYGNSKVSIGPLYIFIIVFVVILPIVLYVVSFTYDFITNKEFTKLVVILITEIQIKADCYETLEKVN